MKAFRVNQYMCLSERLLELHVPIPRELAPQQKALAVMRGFGPITLSKTATGGVQHLAILAAQSCLVATGLTRLSSLLTMGTKAVMQVNEGSSEATDR